MDKTEFIQIEEFEQHADVDPDSLIEEEQNKKTASNEPKSAASVSQSEQDLLDELGI